MAGLRARCTAAIESKRTPVLVRQILPCYMLEATKGRDRKVDEEVAGRLRTAEAIPDADFSYEFHGEQEKASSGMWGEGAAEGREGRLAIG